MTVRSTVGTKDSALLAFEALAGAISAATLQTSLKHAVWVETGERARVAARRLARHDFDQAPVRRKSDPVGYVTRLSLEGAIPEAPVEDKLVPLSADIVMSSNASVSDVMAAFRDDLGLLFVVDRHRISGFVTPSDLNRHPARAHFYLLLADLENALVGLARTRFREPETAVKLLAPSEAKKVRSRYERDRAANLEVDYFAAMDLGHLLTVVGSIPWWRGRLRPGGADRWSETARELIKLRNAVMHPTLEFLGPSRGIDDLLRIEGHVHLMISRLT